jgi:hypothetical protein
MPFATRYNKQDPKIKKALENSFDLGLTPELKKDFEDLACRLSPENLSCDGELPPWQVKIKLREIQAEWKTLEKKAGRAVSESEFPY